MALFGLKNPTPVLGIAFAGLVAYAGYSGDGLKLLHVNGVKQGQERIAAVQDTISRFEAETDSARKQLAEGTMEDLKRRLDNYRSSLELMRRLVPERNEVPNLLDDVSSRARIRGVNVSEFTPLTAEPGPAPFETQKYQFSVLGHYDQIGEFLADVASLQRIIVPIDLTVRKATDQQAKALGDSTGAMLEARFQIRTFVKTATPEEASSGT